MRAALAEATKLRSRALHLAADDVKDFGAVSEAYKLPEETDEQRQARADPAGVGRCHRGAAEHSSPGRGRHPAREANRRWRQRQCVADVAAAAVSARAALEAVLINVEANLAVIRDSSRGEELSERMTGVSWLAAEAERTGHTWSPG